MTEHENVDIHHFEIVPIYCKNKKFKRKLALQTLHSKPE